jgi:hypothetical protein
LYAGDGPFSLLDSLICGNTPLLGCHVPPNARLVLLD